MWAFYLFSVKAKYNSTMKSRINIAERYHMGSQEYKQECVAYGPARCSLYLSLVWPSSQTSVGMGWAGGHIPRKSLVESQLALSKCKQLSSIQPASEDSERVRRDSTTGFVPRGQSGVQWKAAVFLLPKMRAEGTDFKLIQQKGFSTDIRRTSWQQWTGLRPPLLLIRTFVEHDTLL